jgi:hypothetical protein
MHDNPAADWQRLAEHYRSMYDEELDNLAADFDNLTSTAQEVLRSELSTRGLPAPGAKPVVSRRPESAVPENWASTVDPEAGVSRARAFDEAQREGEEDGPKEFTWKTLLCECDSWGQASEIHKALLQAGIESWVEQPGRDRVSCLRVVVAADQLEQAQEIAARPIPKEIIDEYNEEVPEYVPPKCPGCGAEDPVLEGAEPTNSWLCEACGHQWTEPEPAIEADRDKAGK